MPYPIAMVLFLLAAAGCGHLLLSRRLSPDTPSIERWSLYLGVGFWSIAFAGSIAFHLPVHRVGLVGFPLVSACACTVALLGWWTRRHLPPIRPVDASPGERAVFAMAVGVFILFFTGIYHATDTKSCLFNSLDELEDPSPELGLLANRVQGDERFGNVMAVWVFRSFCKTGFDRLGHGFFVSLWFMATVALGRRITGRLWPGIPPALTLLLTDDVFDCELLNQNIIGAMTATLLALVLHGAYRPNTIALVFLGAMLTSARYIMLAGMGVLAVAGLRDAPAGRPGSRRRVLVLSAAMFFLFLLPTAYFLVSGNMRVEAILTQRLLGFPFHSEWVRSPFIPFPMTVGWPLHLVGSVGLILTSLTVLGWMVLLRRRKGDEPWWFLPVYALPSALVLTVQENWFEPEKMSIGLVFAPIFTLGVSCALDWITRRSSIRRLIVAAAVTMATATAWWTVSPALRSWSVPEDRRVRVFYPGLPDETPELMQLERERWLDVGWIAFPSSPGVLNRFSDKARMSFRVLFGTDATGQQGSVDEYAVRFLERSIENRDEVLRAMAPPRPRTSGTGQRLVELALDENPMTSPMPLRAVADAGPEDAALDLTDGRECAMTPVEGLRVSFLNRPLRVLLCRPDDHVAYVILAPPVIPTVEPDGPALPSGTPPAWVFDTPPDLDRIEATRRLILRLPDSVRHVVLAFYLYLDPARYYVREARLEADGTIRVDAPRLGRTN